MNNRALLTDAKPRQRDSLPRSEVINTAATAGTAIEVLNQVLATTRVIASRCEREYYMALRFHSPPLAAAALEHANDVCRHTQRVGERIRELGGTIDSPAGVSLAAGSDKAQTDDLLIAVIADDLAAVRAALDSYRERASFFARFDAPTHRLLEDIISDENARAGDLSVLFGEIVARPAH